MYSGTATPEHAEQWDGGPRTVSPSTGGLRLPRARAREESDVITAYREVGSYRGAAAICGTTHKTVKRIVERQEAGGQRPVRAPRAANYEMVRGLVAGKVKATHGRISASGCCQRRGRPASRGRRATSGGWSRRRRRRGVRYFTAADLVENLYRGLADSSVGRVIDGLLRNDLIIDVAAADERRSLGIGSHWAFDQ